MKNLSKVKVGCEISHKNTKIQQTQYEVLKVFIAYTNVMLNLLYRTCNLCCFGMMEIPQQNKTSVCADLN
jgi:hypothetical protein